MSSGEGKGEAENLTPLQIFALAHLYYEELKKLESSIWIATG
jgi:hypothetical protein